MPLRAIGFVMIVSRFCKALAALGVLALLLSACDVLPLLLSALPTPTDAPPDVPLQAWTLSNGYFWSQPDAVFGVLNGVAPPGTELAVLFGPTEGYIESG
ncbi:MAG: hypothetical protein J7551_10565, partial [Chloroflexi bacterium]|nr:hypothetical protein [Chloroflexota bacterium]